MRGRSAERIADDENEIHAPGVMVASAAVAALDRLTQLTLRTVVGCDDMRQFMQARMFTFADIEPIVRADLHPPLGGVRAADSRAAADGHRIRMRRECRPEPRRLLNGTDVSRAMPVMDSSAFFPEHRPGEFADRQTRGPLGVVRRFLELRRLGPSLFVSGLSGFCAPIIPRRFRTDRALTLLFAGRIRRDRFRVAAWPSALRRHGSTLMDVGASPGAVTENVRRRQCSTKTVFDEIRARVVL